jgi:hypothetical protein
LFVTSDATSWSLNRKVVQWTDGKLSNEGEAIEILNQYGMVADYLSYSIAEGWPVAAFTTDTYLALNSPTVDNHFPQNWTAKAMISGLNNPSVNKQFQLKIYPVPAIDRLTVEGRFEANAQIEIYSSLGQLVKRFNAVEAGHAICDVSDLNAGVYMIKSGNQNGRILIRK